MSSFFMRLPFSDIGASLFTHQGHTMCNDFEMRYVDCMEAYGHQQGSQKCIDFIDDLKECATKEKRIKRMKAMLNERERQIRAGEATYSKTPNPDII